MGIVFDLRKGVSRLLRPDGQEHAAPLEVRRDPLTGRTVHVAHFGAVEAQPLDPAWYRRDEVRGACPFCPEHRDRCLPRFPPELFPEGVLCRGRAVLFPNLYPYDAHGSVCVLSDEHVVPLEGLTPDAVVDGLELGLRFWERVLEADPSHAHPVMAWNYMPPSGGGLVHPHIQFFAFREPGNRYREELAASAGFAARKGRDYWSALLEAERAQGTRYLGRTGRWEWVSAFAPAGILGEILGVLPGAWHLEAMPEGWIGDLCRGLERCFAYFRAAGIHSFNAVLFLGPAGQQHFAAHLRVAPRTFLNLRDHAPDTNFFQVLLEEPVCAVRPEDLASAARSWFTGRAGGDPETR